MTVTVRHDAVYGMNEYTFEGKQYLARSSMPCALRRDQQGHEPHTWDHPFGSVYGPYFCEGVVGSESVTPPITEHVSRDAVRAVIDATLAASFDGPEFCYTEAVERLRSIGIEVTE